MEDAEKKLLLVCREISYFCYKIDDNFEFPLELGQVVQVGHKNDICKPSYLMIYQPEGNTLFIGVRGTKEVRDYLTDALGVAIDFYNTIAHAGFVKSGEYLYKKTIDTIMRITGEKSCNVVITGHSLGGAAASAFAIKLHSEQPSLNVRCVTYGCPGVISVKSAQMCYDYITAIINIGDVIPFACMKNICPMCVNGAKSVANFGKAMAKALIDPKSLSLSDMVNKARVKLTSKWPLLVPPGKVIALGSLPEDKAKVGFAEITDLRRCFECVPDGLQAQNHKITFYGSQLEQALRSL